MSIYLSYIIHQITDLSNACWGTLLQSATQKTAFQAVFFESLFLFTSTITFTFATAFFTLTYLTFVFTLCLFFTIWAIAFRYKCYVSLIVILFDNSILPKITLLGKQPPIGHTNHALDSKG